MSEAAVLPGIKLFDLTNQVAIVTGGSKGLGYAMASGLASAGASIALCSRNADEAEQAARQIGDHYGVRTIGIQAGVTDPQEIETLICTVNQRWG